MVKFDDLIEAVQLEEKRRQSYLQGEKSKENTSNGKTEALEQKDEADNTDKPSSALPEKKNRKTKVAQAKDASMEKLLEKVRAFKERQIESDEMRVYVNGRQRYLLKLFCMKYRVPMKAMISMIIHEYFEKNYPEILKKNTDLFD